MFNFWDFKSKPEFQSFFIGVVKNVAPFNRPVYVFRESKQSPEFHIWGDVQIAKSFYSIPFGSLVRINFLGKYKSETSKFPMNHYEITLLTKSAKIKRKTFKGGNNSKKIKLRKLRKYPFKKFSTAIKK